MHEGTMEHTGSTRGAVVFGCMEKVLWHQRG